MDALQYFVFVAMSFLGGVVGGIFVMVNNSNSVSGPCEDKYARSAISQIANRLGGFVTFYEVLTPSVLGFGKVNEKNIERHEEIMYALFRYFKITYVPEDTLQQPAIFIKNRKPKRKN